MEYFSQIANIIIALAMIITLIFLLWQTILLQKQIRIANEETILANKLAMNQAYQTRYQMYLEMDKVMIENPELKLLISNESLRQAFQANEIGTIETKELAFIEMVMNLCQLSFLQKKDGLNITDLSWLKEILKNKSVKEYWKGTFRCNYKEDFEKFVYAELEKLDAPETT